MSNMTTIVMTMMMQINSRQVDTLIPHLSREVKNVLVGSTNVEVYFNDDDDGDTPTNGSNS